MSGAAMAWSPVDGALEPLLALLALAMVLAFLRLLRGPSLPDRVVALELIATSGVGFTALWAVVAGQPVFLDVAVVLALVSFVGTVAVALHLEHRGRRR